MKASVGFDVACADQLLPADIFGSLVAGELLGVLSTSSNPARSNLGATAGSLTEATMASNIRFLMSAGRPLGAATACQELTLASLTPLSSRVGTSGSEGERFELVIASARSLPALILG